MENKGMNIYWDFFIKRTGHTCNNTECKNKNK